MNKLDYTEEEYKEMCAKLNQFKSTRSIVDRDVLTKQEYNLDRNKKYLSKKCKPSIQDCINILKKEGYKIYKEKIEWVEI